MDIISNWQENRHRIISLFTVCLIWVLILDLVHWFGRLCSNALSQPDQSNDPATGSARFPSLPIINLGFFITSLVRGRLDTEIGAREVLATNRGSKLNDINGFGLTTCWDTDSLGKASVVMLSSKNQTPHSSIGQFMKYISHAYGVESILLKCIPLKSAVQVAAEEICECSEACRCIVFWTVEEITNILVRRMPGTLKRLSDFQCLLPCLNCLRKGCHECNHGLLHVKELDVEENDEFPRQRLREGVSKVEPAAAVCEILDDLDLGVIQDGHSCICIPTRGADQDDEWTKLLITSLRSTEKVATEVKVLASDALENYMKQSGEYSDLIVEEYKTAFFIVPRFIEVLLNVVLTALCKMDGFSSSLLARWIRIRNFIVNSNGTGFAITAFIQDIMVKWNAESTCQVLRFRGSLLSLRKLSLIVGCVNLFCSLIWCVLVAYEGGVDKWYGIPSLPPSKHRVAVIIAAIGIALGMDCCHLYINWRDFLKFIDSGLDGSMNWRKTFMFWAAERDTLMVWGAIVLEIICIVTGSIIVAEGLGLQKGHGRWVYSALQGLVWLKWGIGSYLLGDGGVKYAHPRNLTQFFGNVNIENPSEMRLRYYDTHDVGHYSRQFIHGTLVHSSAFLLNAVLTVVQGEAVLQGDD